MGFFDKLFGGKDKEEEIKISLISAVKKGQIEIVEKLLRNGVAIDVKDKDGCTALMIAIEKKHTEIAKMLLANGAEVNAKNEDGDTALTYAAVEGNTEIAEMLLANGADVNAKNKNGSTALIGAIWKNHTQTIKMLLSKGADVNTIDIKNSTPLMYALYYSNDIEIVKMLLANGAYVSNDIISKIAKYFASTKAIEMLKQSGYIKELYDIIKFIESAIADAKTIGWDVTEPQKVLNEARSAFSAGNYSEGIAVAKSCFEEMKRRLSHFNELKDQIKSAESAIADAEKIGCDVTKPQELLNKARSALSAGNYTEGITLAKNCIEEMKKRLADFNELKDQIKSAESAIADAEKIGCDDVTKPQEVLNKARSAHSAGNYTEGIALAKSCIAESKRLQADARPEITLELTKLNFRPNYWEKLDIILRNTGTAHAKAINLSFSKEVEVKGLKEMALNIRDEERLSIMLMPKNAGDIPLEVDIKYQDLFDNAYHTKTEFILNVGEDIREERKREIGAPAVLPAELAQDYQDIQLIGQGGFAKVFKAERARDRKEVAIKIPIALDQATGRTFLQEIENWTQLNHSNIVRIYRYNILPIPFFEMELCDESLDEYLKQNQINLQNAVWIIFNTAEGLKLAHSLKIIHRDLKPHNILLKDGVPKITDWGLSKVMTQSSSSKGGFTPYYAAPEQMSGKEKDERTDVWGLGAIFYQMTTGKLPFDGETPMEIMMNILTKEPVRPSELNLEIDFELEKVILKSLSKAPEDRYQSVGELQMDLAKYLQIGLKEDLFKSKSAKDVSKSAYYCADLFLVCLKINDGVNACKYIEDLIGYTKGDTKDGLINIRDGIEYRIERKMDIPEDIVAQADILVHKIKIGSKGKAV